MVTSPFIPPLVRAAHHLEIMCRLHQSENGTPGQSRDETIGYGHEQSIKVGLQPHGLVGGVGGRGGGGLEN